MQFPEINTIEDFCAATGWPELEFKALLWTEALAILALYDLEIDFVFHERAEPR